MRKIAGTGTSEEEGTFAPPTGVAIDSCPDSISSVSQALTDAGSSAVKVAKSFTARLGGKGKHSATKKKSNRKSETTTWETPSHCCNNVFICIRRNSRSERRGKSTDHLDLKQ